MSSDYKIWENCLSSDSDIVKKGKGQNIIPEPKPRSLWLEYLDKFKDPLIIILCVILVLSCGVTAYEIAQSHDYKLLFEPAGILMAILLSTGIGFYFEVRANREFKVLNKVRDEDLVKVIRRKGDKGKPKITKIKKCDIVVGELVKLESGDEVPADGHIISGESVRVDESAYTGEPNTVKGANTAAHVDNEAYKTDFLLRGSIILEGSCYMVVSAIGVDTEEGKGAVRIQQSEDVETPLNRQLDQLGHFLTTASYIIAGLIFVGRLLYYFIWDNPADHTTLHLIEYTLNSIMIAVTLIVVAVPEGLPMSVTVSLALSMRKMLKENNLVRKLHACETMGATTVICTDKTGTLTENRMTVIASRLEASEKQLCEAISVNSTAELTEKEDGQVVGVGNPTEVALLHWLKDSFGVNYSELRDSVKVIDRIPFSTETKYMSTTVADEGGESERTFIKGAPELVLDMCSDFGSTTKEEILKELSSYQSKAMRTLAFAVGNESGIVSFMGIVGIADPVREGVKEAIETCNLRAGVRVIMVTGDVAATAKEIGRQLSLITEEDSEEVCLSGTEFCQMSDEQIMEVLPKLKVLSRAKPEDKARLVELLQRMGEVVAVTGDGTNDALALKKAQVGLSMGDGTARAKEVSDITILDNSFSSINKAIMWGRSLYMNIRRFIIFQMTINVCACFVVLIGAFTGIDSPLTVTQMLWVNLIMDTFAAMALSSLPADKSVMDDKPRNPNCHIIDRKMMVRILWSGLVFFVFLAGLWQLFWHSDFSSVRELIDMNHLRTYFAGFFDFSKNKIHVSNYESGVFFTTFVILQFWNLFNTRYYRTGRGLFKDMLDIIRGKRKMSECFSRGFLLIAGVILIGQLLIVNVAGSFFDVAPLSIQDWGWIILMTSPILLIPEIVRTFSKRA